MPLIRAHDQIVTSDIPRPCQRTEASALIERVTGYHYHMEWVEIRGSVEPLLEAGVPALVTVDSPLYEESRFQSADYHGRSLEWSTDELAMVSSLGHLAERIS